MSDLSFVKNNLSRKKRRISLIWVFAFLAVYFGFYALLGSRGVYQMIRLEDQITTKSARLTELRSQRENLEHRVKLMSPDRLDLDMLDQRARTVLNHTHADDIVIRYDDLE